MTDAAEQIPHLFQHKKRREWGFAIMAWERDGKRGYQFEDGELRVFKEGYYQLLEEMPDVANGAAIMARLEAKRATAAKKDDKKKRGSGRRSGPDIEDLPTMGEQVLVFLDLFPRGFDDPKWIKEHRGGDGRALKRHRAPAIKRAQDSLAKDSLEALVNAGQTRSVIERACEVLDKTDLVTKSQVDPLRDTGRDSRLAQALLDFLHGDGDLETRFAMLCRALATATRKPPSWQLATALGALVHPTEFVCVRPSVFSNQARTMAGRLRPTKSPTSATFVGYNEMARKIQAALIKEGQEPADLLDSHDFIWVTLRPAANEILLRIRAEAAQAAAASAAAADSGDAKQASSEGASQPSAAAAND